jgi:Flp pilus assembly protein TadG
MTPLMSSVARLPWHGRGQLVREEGVALVEFAFVLPLLLVLVLGIVDFGKAFNYKNDETHLANQAARYAAVNNSPDPTWATDNTTKATPNLKINCALKNQAASNEFRLGTGSVSEQASTPSTLCTNPTSGINVRICFPATGASHVVGDPVEVTVRAHYNWFSFLSLKGALPGLGSDMTTSATMRIEQAPTDPSVASAGTSLDAYVANGTYDSTTKTCI